jgi:adenylate cyclase
MKQETYMRLSQLKVIIIAWLALGFLMTVYDHLVLHTANSLGHSAQYSFWLALARNMGGGLIGGLTGGSMLVFYINAKYHDKPYTFTILLITISFVLIVSFIAVIMGMIMVPMHSGKPLSHPASQAAFRAFLKDPQYLKAAIAWYVILAVTQLLLQLNSKFGQGAFWNIVRGRYNTPREEKRTFMFLDINSSTTIAEQLGDEKYHALLKDFFADITYPILDNKGSIYQYVGDEVVVAWNFANGRENMQSIKCFFDMKLRIREQKEKYLRKYGLVPSFKAGIHCGRVIGGEVGVMKRDVTYSGDVLNTTARILSKCNEFNAEVIASADVLSGIASLTDYVSRPLGAIKLKGKEKEVMLNALALAA